MINLRKSLGSWLCCGKRQLLDFHGGYGSNPIGWNHPKLVAKLSSIDTSFIINKPANSDFQTVEYNKFFKNFRTILPKNYPHLFFIDGGASAVENALKVAMDWKYQKLKQENFSWRDDLKILHFEQAFHGRSGYTMSLTNTDPHKVKRFSKFDWPRVKIEGKSEHILNRVENKLHSYKDIAAIIIEPIQCEGGDRHFEKDFLTDYSVVKRDNNSIYFDIESSDGSLYESSKRGKDLSDSKSMQTRILLPFVHSSSPFSPLVL